MITVRWDGFARQGLERLCKPNGEHIYSCSWCGQIPNRVFSYNGLGWFCNLDCFESYHG